MAQAARLTSIICIDDLSSPFVPTQLDPLNNSTNFVDMKKLLFTLLLIAPMFLMAQSSIQEFENIPYYPADHEHHSDLTKVNVLAPSNARKAPVFMWIGGGAWAYVNRHQEMNLCRRFAEEGIVVVSVGHRLSPALLGEKKRHEGIKHPEHVKDVASAIKWVKENISRYGGDPESIFIGGFSSGAHLSALVAVDKRYLEDVGMKTTDLKGVLPVGGGYDIPDYKKAMFIEDSTLIKNHINVVFGETHEEHIDASPLTYIDDFLVPMLMVSESYTYPFTKIYEEALAAKGYTNFQVLHCLDHSHASLWKALSNDQDCEERDYMVDFILKESADSENSK